MKKNKKILVITDNEYLLNKFQEIVQELHIRNADFYYGCSPTNDKLNNLTIKIFNLKDDYLKIINDFNLVISLHCKQIFPKGLVKKIKCINVHPGYNPYNRGWYPHVFSIINKLPAGATIHEMDEYIDHGPIIAQKQIPIRSYDDSLSIYNKIIKTELLLIKKHLKDILDEKTVVKSIEEGNINYQKDYTKLCKFDLNESGTFGYFLDRMRSLSHNDFKNAYFVDETEKKIYFRLVLDPVDRNLDDENI